MALLRLEGVSKTYVAGIVPVHALRDVTLSLDSGEFLAVMGPSGSGKSTLLHLMGGLDVPTRGRVLWRDRDLGGMSTSQRARWRSQHVGFVFQAFQLLPHLTARENVELPLVLQGVAPKERRRRAEALLERVGLLRRRAHKPSELSGGEQQRVAIARALITNPEVLLADEPTGNLDSETGHQILELIRELNERDGLTVVLATHNREAASYAHAVVELRDGRLTGRAPSTPPAAGPPP